MNKGNDSFWPGPGVDGQATDEIAVITGLADALDVDLAAAVDGTFEWPAIWRLSAAAFDAIERGDRARIDLCVGVLRGARCCTLRCRDLLQSETPRDLRSRFGGFAEADAPLEIDGAFDETHLDALLSNRLNAIHVRRYADPGLCADLAERLGNLPTTVWTYGDDEARMPTDVFTVGIPAQTATSDASRQRYRDQDFEIVRHLFRPNLSPLDRFRLELDAISPHGATVRGGSDGQRRLAGIVRIYKPQRGDERATDGQTVCERGEEGYLHIDCLQERAASMFSYNIYLDLPDVGGDLTLYNIAAPTFDKNRPLRIFGEFLRNFEAFQSILASLDTVNTVDADVHAHLASFLPKPVVIRPAPGDLILINPGVPHAVRDLPRGRRVSIQGFLKVLPGKPIRMTA